MPFGYPDIFVAQPIASRTSSWLTSPVLFDNEPVISVDDAKKKAFALEWAKLPSDPFNAACNVFGADTTSALWASRNWILDPEVNAIKDHYLKTSETTENLLDKKAFAARLLKFSEEKNFEGTRYIVEAKDRLKALELYGKTMGFMAEASINNGVINNTNNELKIVFVEPEIKENLKLIDNTPDNESEILEGAELPFAIKLVG